MSELMSQHAVLELCSKTGQRLSAESLTIATAESCTGGLLASILTDVAGSSAYMLGGVVSYSNHAKMLLLNVQDATLQAHGAVSAETAAEMAQGVRRLLGSDIGLSTTGVAGPGGGTPDKPVGTVYVHISAPDAEWGEHHIWPYDRSGNKLASVQALLDLTGRYLDQRTVSDQRPNSPQILDVPVIVEASASAGWWKPTVVWIQDQRWDIVGWGRQTEQADGSTVVMVEADGGAGNSGARFELVVDMAAGQWRLRRAWWPRRSA